MDGGMVDFDICEGNPGALTFMVEAYLKYDAVKAERGFRRLRDAGIQGAWLYKLWNDCCGRNTRLAVDVMVEEPIEEIEAHLGGYGSRGIPFTR